MRSLLLVVADTPYAIEILMLAIAKPRSVPATALRVRRP
jgi:hypothetical protein